MTVILDMMQLPQARIVKQGGQLYAPPPPAPTRKRSALKQELREAAALAIGMWPLVAVLMLVMGFFISATYWSAP